MYKFDYGLVYYISIVLRGGVTYDKPCESRINRFNLSYKMFLWDPLGTIVGIKGHHI